jgi:hypothetical protein
MVSLSTLEETSRHPIKRSLGDPERQSESFEGDKNVVLSGHKSQNLQPLF